VNELVEHLRKPVGLLALMQLPGVGPVKARAIAQSGSLEGLGFSDDVLRTAYENARTLLITHDAASVQVIGIFDEAYPKLLATLRDAPPVLFARGEISLLKSLKMVAVVGTRTPTLFGQSATDFLTRAIAKAGFGICSGLALGIDGIAHQIALEEGVPTIAVLGGGLDNVTPAAHLSLARDIVRTGGLLVSEQPFGVVPQGSTLTLRNRIQTGLSCGVLIGQTDIKSGTMYTANYAMLQERPIYCPQPPKQVVVPNATKGLHALLQIPANQLPSTLQAFRSSGQSCLARGDEPIAKPVSRDNLYDMLEDFVAQAQAHQQSLIDA
jgi:DNA processing protein